MSLKQFKLPDVGEGLTEGEILSWRVQPGDTVTVNQILVEVETAKAAVELPSPYAGVVTELHVDEGATVDVGAPIITIETEPAGSPVGAAESSPPAQSAAVHEDLVPAIPTPSDGEAVEPGLIGGPAPGGRTSVLVGYGPKITSAKRRPRTSTPATPELSERGYVGGEPRSDNSAGAATGTVHVLAKPPVRKLARDLGVDLTTVTPSGLGGTITRSDVEAAGAVAVAPSPVAATVDREERRPIKGVRKMTAEAMVRSAFTAPHVTEFLTVDITRSMRLVDKLKRRSDFDGVRVSPLLLVMKALLLSIKRYPEINASWDEAAQEIVVKRYVNLGIAAATPRGLIVPNIKDAHALALPDLARALTELTSVARDGKTAPGDMAGGTITITNVGVFGVDTGTPILNPGEAAILAFGAVRPQPWVHKGKVVPRQVTTLALSFDHRLVDGELGSRFLADVGAVLEDPELALTW
jgi:2-oxoisovalerate dehydrogenase E2 component (dihydrolipoyl transacylase)